MSATQTKEPTALDVMIQRLRENNDYLEKRRKQEGIVMSAQSELLKLHQDIADRSREKVNQLEQLLGMIPGCEDDFYKAKTILALMAESGSFTRLGAGTRSARAEQDQKEFREERESHCSASVSIVGNGTERTIRMFCTNCNEFVVTEAATEETKEQEWADAHLADWQRHIASKSPTDQLKETQPRPTLAAGEHNRFSGGRW